MTRGAESLLWRETASHPAPFSTIHAMRLRAVPCLALAACFIFGVLCRGWWQPASSCVLLCASLLAVSVAALRYAPRIAIYTVAALWIALGWTCALLEPVGRDDAPLQYADGLQRAVMGHVTAVHAVAAPEDDVVGADARARVPVQRVDVALEQVETVDADRSAMVPASGGVSVTLLADGTDVPVIPCGTRVRAVLRMRPPQRYLDPGVWRYDAWLNDRGIAAQAATDIAKVERLPADGLSLQCRMAGAQQWAAARLPRWVASFAQKRVPRAVRLSTDDVRVMNAMLFGERSGLDRALRLQLERTGSFHLLVVAGLHVGLVVAGVYAVCLWLPLRRPLAAAIALAVAAGYALMTGFGAPVQRALFMCAVYLLSRTLLREQSGLNALGVAVLAMLLLHPAALYEASFQMTVLALVAIGGMAVPLWQRTGDRYLRATREIRNIRTDAEIAPRAAQMRLSLRWVGDAMADAFGGWIRPLPAWTARGLLWVAELLLISLVAECVMALPMAVYFHRVTALAAPAALLTVPIVALLMGAGAVTFLLSLVHPLAAALPAIFTAVLLHAVRWSVSLLAGLRSADVRVPAPVMPAILFAICVWCAAVWMLRWQRGRARAALLLIPLAVAGLLWPVSVARVPGALEMTAIDVGQGDSLFVMAPDGASMLIDAGGPTGAAGLRPSADTWDVGEEVVSPYLWSRRVRRLDVLVLTHAHSDHIGGMGAVLRNFRPRELWISAEPPSARLQDLLAKARGMGTSVRVLRAGAQEVWGGVDVRVLGPAVDYANTSEPRNDDSLVLQLAYGKSSVLAEGDAERREERFLESEPLQPVTLLKVGHHGSITSTDAALVSRLKPAVAVISCGRGNTFGHPRREVLQRLQDAGAKVSRTDTMGAMQYLLYADGHVETHALAAAYP